jgi:hypothetical protein
MTNPLPNQLHIQRQIEICLGEIDYINKPEKSEG